MHVLEGEEELHEPLGRALDGDAPPAVAPQARDVRREVAARRVLHHDAELAHPDKRSVVPHDVRVLERGQNVDLALGLLLVGVAQVRDGHPFGDAQQAVVAPHQVDGARAARAEPADRRAAGRVLDFGRLRLGDGELR